MFQRHGTQVKEFRKTWASACRAAGVGKKHFHDFRRTAARNMIRAGVPQTVAMSITGHKTVSMFNRYDITSQDDRREALRRTAEHVAAAPRAGNVIALNRSAPDSIPGHSEPRKRTECGQSAGTEKASRRGLAFF